MITKLRHIDLYCNLEYSREANQVLQGLDTLLQSTDRLDLTRDSLESIRVSNDVSVESFGERVKAALKKIWEFLLQICKNIKERLQAQQRQSSQDKSYQDGSAKRAAKSTPTPAPDVKSELLKVAKAIDEQLTKGDETPLDIQVQLPFSDRKVDALLRKLQSLLSSNQKRYSSKLAVVLPGVDFRSLVGLIYSAHYSVSDVIIQILNDVKNLYRNQDISNIRKQYESLENNHELKALLSTLTKALHIDSADTSTLEHYKAAILALQLRFNEEDSVGYSSTQVVEDLFDSSKSEIFKSIDQVTTTLGLIAKDKLAKDLTFLYTVLQEAQTTDTSRVAFEDVDYIKNVLHDVLYLLQATDAFVRMILKSTHSEKLFIEKFLDVQTFLSAKKE